MELNEKLFPVHLPAILHGPPVASCWFTLATLSSCRCHSVGFLQESLRNLFNEKSILLEEVKDDMPLNLDCSGIFITGQMFFENNSEKKTCIFKV